MGPFDQLKWIGKEKDKKMKDNNLEILIDLFRFARDDTVCDLADLEEDPVEVYERMVKFVRKSTWNSKIITELSLKDFVNVNFDSSYCVDEKIILGIFTGCLLTLLTEYNRREKKRTRVVIDGHGRGFDHLFSCARYVDELVLKNLKGSRICSNVASHNGKANAIVIDGVKGEEVLIEAGGLGGRIKGISLTNCSGDRNLSSIGFSAGQVGTIIAKNNIGSLLCSGLAVNGGKAGSLIIADHVGELTGYLMGIGGKIENAIFLNLVWEAYHFDNKRFSVNNLFTNHDSKLRLKEFGTYEKYFFLERMDSIKHKEIVEIIDANSRIIGRDYKNTIEALYLINLLNEKYKDGKA